MHPYKIALSASAALLASTSLSSATLYVQTNSFSGSTNWGTTNATPSFTPTNTLSFTGFNPAMGTLTSVSVQIVESILGSVNMTNNGTSTTNVSGNLLNTMKAVIPIFGLKTLSTASSSVTDPTLAAGASTGLQSVSGGSHTTKAFSSSLAVFETGWKLTIGDLGQVTVSAGNSNGSATYTDIGAVAITVDYSYTAPPSPPSPTPEPATLALLGSGLAGLGALRRRRKSV